MRQTLCKIGDSLVLTLPSSFVEQHSLVEGTEVSIHETRGQLTVSVGTRPHYKLSDLLADMPADARWPDGWEDVPEVGLEILPAPSSKARSQK